MRVSRSFSVPVSLLTVGAFALTACSSQGNSGEQSASAESSNGGAVELTYVHRLPDGEGMVKVADIVAEWNKEHPDIKVDSVKFDGKADELIKKLETDVKADNAPCLAQVGYSELAEVYVKGLVQDVSAEAEKYKDGYASGAFDAMSIDGKYFGIPQDTGPLVYFYNKAEFDKLGIAPPTDLNEFHEAAAKAAAAGKYIVNLPPDEAGSILPALSAAAGNPWYEIDGSKWVINADGPGAVKVTDFWQTMLDEKLTSTLPRWDDSFKAALNSKEIIGTIGAAWDAALLQGDMTGSENEGEWAVAQLPDFGNGQVTGPNGGSGVAVLKGCQYPAEAMQFNDWFNQQTASLASQGLVVASSKETPDTPEQMKAFYGGQDVMSELLQANNNMASNVLTIPGYSSVMPKINQAASDLIAGKLKAKDLLDVATTESKATLQNLGLEVAE